MLALCRYPEIVEEALVALEPCVIVQYILKLRLVSFSVPFLVLFIYGERQDSTLIVATKQTNEKKKSTSSYG
jgi:hypothetical protein